ncbi:MAG: hypothetical protein K6G61_00410 [Solobacterium sp.]|nr:hypothetical protein [Solobacterium sp.]
MEYIGLIFGIFGLMAYLEVSSLKSRVTDLERQLTNVEGTRYSEDRASLIKAARSYIGQSVLLELKEDHEDVDITMYGNTKHGTNTLLDMDEEWMLVRVESKKKTADKLIRLESVARIGAK